MSWIYYVITTPFIIILLIILYLIIKTYNDIDNFIDFIQNIAKSTHFNFYIESVSENMQKVKLGKHKSPNNFKDEYLKNLKLIDKKFNSMLTKYILKCNILVEDIPIFQKYEWKFLMSTNNLELGMPYTINDTIIIPENLLNSIYIDYIRNNKLQNAFINTLIHEKIHIIQRFNQKKFNKYYKSRYDFVKRLYTLPIPDHINNLHMNNPDSNNQIWIYNISNREYYTLLKYNHNNIYSIGIDVKTKKEINIDNLKNKLGFKSDISIYHPNEIFACEVAKKIQKNNIKDMDIKYLKSLK